MSVLRDVSVQAGALVLARPGGAAPAAPKPAAVAPVPAPDIDARLRDSYRQGHAQGYAEGQQAEKKAAEGRAEAAGYREGLARGMAQARKEAAAEVERHVALLQGVLRDARAAAEPLPGDAEDDLVALCFEAVCAVLGERAATPDGLRALLRQAAARLHGERVITLRLHPADLALLREDPAWPAGDTWTEGVLLAADGNVALGGAVLETMRGTLDARLETQLAALKELLLRQRAALEDGA